MNRRLLLRLTRASLLICLALLGILLGIFMHRRQQPRPSPQALVAFLDVGDGDCTLIRTIDGTTILLDAGRAGSASIVVHDLQRFGVRKIDLLALASSDPKSLGGVPAILNAFPTVAVWDNAATGNNEARRSALEAIRRRHIPSRTVQAGDNIQIGGATFWTAVWPPAHDPRNRLDSIVYRLNFGETRFLFEGPSRPDGEQYLMAAKGDTLGCDDGGCTDLILQAPAGGADGGTTPELLRMAAPSVIVVSCSAQKPPSPGVLRHVQASGAALWRTDTQGTVVVLTDGRGTPTLVSVRL